MNLRPKRTHLYLSVAILNIPYLLCGTMFVWSSPVLLKLSLTDDEGSTVASMLSLGSVLGPFVTGAILDSLGRKHTLGLTMVLSTGSYLILGFSNGVVLLCVGRFIGGVASSMAFCLLPLYVAELSEDSVRGTLNTLNQISINSGCLLMYCLGPFLSYDYLHYIMLGLCLLFFPLFPFLPQSPYSLVAANKQDEARDTLLWLREGQAISRVERELQLIQLTVQESKAQSGSVLDLFTSRGNRTALTICTTLLILQQATGLSVLVYYTEKIFRMSGVNLSSSISSILIGIFFTIFSFITPVAVKHWGYKTPLLVSTTGMGLGMGGLGIFFLLKSKDFPLDFLNWMPLISITTYGLFFNTGFGNIPWALTGELFPGNIKAAAATFIASTSGLSAFFTSLLFPTFVNLMGIEFVFFTCSLFCGVSFLFVAVMIQDTSGMSFVEIQEVLNGRRRKHRDTLSRPV